MRPSRHRGQGQRRGAFFGGGGPTALIPSPPTGDWTPGTTIEGAALPLVKLNTAFTLNGGTVHNVTSASEMNTALTASASQDNPLIVVTSSFDTSASFTPPARTGAGTCQIIATTFNTGSPPKAPGQRVVAGDSANLRRIRSTSSNTPVFIFNHGATHPSYYRLIGLEITSTQNQQNGLVEVRGATATVANQCEWIGLDRCYLWGNPGTVNIRRGFVADGRSIYCIDTSILGMRDAADSDSQAIAMSQGAGPLRVVNSRLQAASENFMSGGQSSSNTPSDLEFAYCHFDKLPAWEGVYPVKNNFELKFAHRVYVYGCLFDYCWNSGQTGPSIVVKSTSQTGVGDGTQYATTDVIFDRCIMSRFQIPFHIFGSTEDSTQDTDNVVMRHCAFVQQRSGDGQGYYISQGAGALNGVVTKNCTIESNQTYWHHNVDLGGSTPKGDSFTFEDNLLEAGLVASWTGGPFGASGGISGTTALSTAFTTYSVTKNAIRGDWTANVASGNTMSTSTTWANIFVNYAGGDYNITPGNWAAGTGTGGANPGVNMTELSSATQYTTNGQRPSEV